MPTTEGYVTTADEVRLFFQQVGNAGSAVLIPGRSFLINTFARLAGGRTLIFYDSRNRGRSDLVTDATKLHRGIHHDVDDLETVRRHLALDEVAVLGHSYYGLIVALYAMAYPTRVTRVVQIGAVQPDAARDYPAHLTGADAVSRDIAARLAQLQAERAQHDPAEFARRSWALFRLLYVGDPADADKVDWSSGALPNESPANVMTQWNEHLHPSLQRLQLTAADMAALTAPVLTIHGRKDRQAPYGGGREWALRLPHARLLTIAGGAHLPWIEDPETVFPAIDTFLDGTWPEGVERVESLDAT